MVYEAQYYYCYIAQMRTAQELLPCTDNSISHHAVNQKGNKQLIAVKYKDVMEFESESDCCRISSIYKNSSIKSLLKVKV